MFRFPNLFSRTRPAPKQLLLTVLQCIVIYIGIAIPCFWFVHLQSHSRQLLYMAFILLLDAFVVWLLFKLKWNRILSILVSLDWLRIALMIFVFLLVRNVLGPYRSEPIQSDFFVNKKVMFLVPHQDDDINLGGGVIEQYTRNGSQVTMVFSTNGDSLNIADIRSQEAVKVAEMMGIPKDNVYYLGFGDDWMPLEYEGESIAHIYNSPQEDLVWTSRNGQQETYDTAAVDCYQSVSYTRENYVNSIYSIISEIRPDVIYVTDYDAHNDHRALSLMAEEAIHKILQQDSNYCPTVYKGFCYRTAWYGKADFMEQLNLASTVQHTISYDAEISQYPWEERVRVPVLSTGLNRFVTQTDTYEQLKMYESQKAVIQAVAIINGDKVFWERRTDSVLYDALIESNGELIELLNDFKLMDTANINNYATEVINSGVHVMDYPVTIHCASEKSLKVLGLYDDPSLENHILKGYILLPDGNQIEFGPLNNNGSVSFIPIGEQTISSFSIHITESTGIPGLTEVEAYSTDVSQPSEDIEYFMFLDSNDNFVYDYFIDSPDNTQNFTLYTYPHNTVIDPNALDIRFSGSEECTYRYQDGVLSVYCPESKSCTITASYQDISCSMVFSNPSVDMEYLLGEIKNIDGEIPFMSYDNSLGSLASQINYYKGFLESVMGRIQYYLT